METYSTYEDIIAVVPERDIIDITDAELTGAARTAIVARARERSYNLINSYCGGRYIVPFNPVPSLVRDIEVDLSSYFIYQRSLDDKVAESIRNKYTDSIKLLERIESGRIRIDCDAAPGETATAVGVTTNARPRLFTDAILGQL